MALIVCEECGKEFSNQACACPNCGCPNVTDNNTIIVKSNTLPVSQDTVPREEVVQHLKYAAQLETALFTFKTAYNKIEQKFALWGTIGILLPPLKHCMTFLFGAPFSYRLRYY